MFSFDHIAVCCEDLADGVAAVAEHLGVPLTPGGRHPHFGTHNALLSLGGSEYLEVIAIDPAAGPRAFPRWFDLDRFAGPPQLANWILACDDLDAGIARVGAGAGRPVPLSRGDYRWRMAVPESGVLPYDNLHPALIAWDGPHPARRLPESGCSLRSLEIRHPSASRLRDRLALDDPRITFEAGSPRLSATISTPAGARTLF